MLEDLWAAAARGTFPADRWAVEVVAPVAPGILGYVAAFTGFHVVAADVTLAEVQSRADPDDPAWPMNPAFLAWLRDRIGATKIGHIDVVLAAAGTGRGAGLAVVAEPPENERTQRARRMRRDVRYFGTADGTVMLGRGIAGRLEASIELTEGSRSAGLGTTFVRSVLGEAPEGEAVFAQVAPGNVRSLRCFLAAGFRPVGAEVFLR